MDKKEVEEILITVKLGQDIVLNMKIYKNGIICRQGCGGTPEIGISTITFTEKTDIFDTILGKISQQVCDLSITHTDEKIIVPLEYILCFYGDSINGETGERAEWKKSSGIKILIDSNSTFRDPILGFIDNLAMDAAEITNSIYFDAMIKVMYNMISSALPESIIATPKTENELKKSFGDYLYQMNASVRKWDLISLGLNKTYKTPDGVIMKPNFSKRGKDFSFQFIPISNDKKWWRFK